MFGKAKFEIQSSLLQMCLTTFGWHSGQKTFDNWRRKAEFPESSSNIGEGNLSLGGSSI
jgi:hypothetical protein